MLAAHGLENVTLTNLDPAKGEVEDAEALSYADGSFDFGIVSAALHHCRSPPSCAPRAVSGIPGRRARARGPRLDADAAREPARRRGGVRVLTVVAAEGFRAGGVANSAVPNYVYRWTEREVEKTIRSAAPERRHRFLWFRARAAAVRPRGDGEKRLARPRWPLRALVTVLPGQANLFAFAVLKGTSSRGCAARASRTQRRSVAASAAPDPTGAADRMPRCPLTEPETRDLQGFSLGRALQGSPMRIAVVRPQVPFERGGAEIMADRLVEGSDPTGTRPTSSRSRSSGTRAPAC